MVEAREKASTDRDGWAGQPDGGEGRGSRRNSARRGLWRAVSVVGKRGAGMLLATQRDIPANFLDDRNEFTGCGSNIELFRFEMALGYDHKIHSRRQ